jgi:chromosome segregation protein
VKGYIEKLVIEGFKSYGRQRIEIPLGEGFIAVVGPNGAGKSNIGDAISFALGIATSKALRAKNLSYLIFSKDGERADYAYVEVHFKNFGAFPVPEEDVVVSRKVYRDGRSVFRINGQVVKEKELSDFLSKAGIYENGYNVVLQGDIVRFLKMTPVERRKLIEEVAGIGEYEERKQKALVQLGEVELKHRELRLLIDEMEVQMEKLAQEVERIRLYRDLSQRKRDLEVKLFSKELLKVLEEKTSTEQRLMGLEEEIRQLKAQAQKLQEEASAIENGLSFLRTAILPFKEKTGRLSERLDIIQKETEDKYKEIERLQEEVENARRRITHLERDLEVLSQEEEELKEVIRQKEEEVQKLQGEFDVINQELKEKEREMQSAFEDMHQTEEKVRAMSKAIEEKKKEASTLGLKIKELELKEERVREELKNLEEELKKVKGSLGEDVLSKENYQKMLREEEFAQKRLRAKLEEVENQLKKLRAEREDVLQELAVLRERLRSAEQDYLPFEDIEGVYGRVADLIKVKDYEYLRAVEVAGGQRLSFVVVEDEETAKRCIQRLKETKGGRMSFIPLNRIKEQTLPPFPRARGAVVIDYVVNLVEYDKKFEKAIRFVFGDTLVVENFDSAKALGIGNYRMVSLEGELFEKTGVISGGHWESRASLGKSFYEEKTKQLEEVLERLKESISEKEALAKSLRDELVEKEGVVKILERRLKELEQKHKEGFERIKGLEERVQKGKEYLKTLAEEKENAQKRKRELEEELSYQEEKLENLRFRYSSLLKIAKESGFEALRERAERHRKFLERKKEELFSLKLKEQEVAQQRQNLLQDINQRKARVEDLIQNIENAQKRIRGLSQEKERIEEELKDINLQAYELYKRVDQSENQLREITSLLGQKRMSIDLKTEERIEIERELSKLTDRQDQLLERLKELGQEEPLSLVPEGYSKLKDELSKVEREISLLGNINFKAEEDYQELKNRHTDYVERDKKLLEERRAIKELLEEIESKKLKAFLKAYEQINKSFSKIFARLSPGGKAFMQLEKEDEPFEGGINLVVKPRGKEVQYLEAISGGEKTLGALSLIFALQDYKPSIFYYFDEVDAHLDEANARTVGELIKERSQTAQFIVVTLREILASFADKLIGVSSRGGISKIFPLKNLTHSPY